jgi:hypothetical protein
MSSSRWSAFPPKRSGGDIAGVRGRADGVACKGLRKAAGPTIMIQAEADKAKNLLRVTYAGCVGPEQTRRAVETLQRRLADLAPGFRLLTNLSGLEEMDIACVPDVKKMMDLCNKKGVDTVVRVIPDPHKDIGLNILSLFHYRRRVRIITCETMGEALRALGDRGLSVQGETTDGRR